MKLKKTIMLLILILLTGCTAEYNLIIDENKNIEESLIVLQPNSFWGKNKEEIENQIYWTLVFSKDETEPAYFYNQEKIIGSVNSGVKYNYKFNKDNFISDSDIIRNCFDSYDFYLDQEMLNISATGFKCSETLGNGYNLTINIIVDGKVIRGNYDKNKENKYTWIISEGEDVSINLVMDLTKSQTVLEYYEENKYLGLVIIGIVALLCTILLVAYIKNKKNNS